MYVNSLEIEKRNYFLGEKNEKKTICNKLLIYHNSFLMPIYIKEKN